MGPFPRVLSLAALLLVPGLAHAHALLLSPTPRNNNAGIKVGPCGGLARTGNPAVFTAGQTLTLTWQETINHPGYYRISFSPAGDADWVVLADNIPNPGGLQASNIRDVTLPNLPCTDCTIQLIQVMTENPAAPSNYYSCADIRLDPAPGTEPTPTQPPPPPADGGSVQEPNPGTPPTTGEDSGSGGGTGTPSAPGGDGSPSPSAGAPLGSDGSGADPQGGGLAPSDTEGADAEGRANNNVEVVAGCAVTSSAPLLLLALLALLLVPRSREKRAAASRADDGLGLL